MVHRSLLRIVMKPRNFKPGFRLSALDVIVIVLTSIAVGVLSTMSWLWAASLAFVVCHFFLFCNVVRMARPLELIWAVTFVALASTTIIHGSPSAAVTAGISLLLTMILVVIEMRKPSYHGIAWQTINPHLPSWWQARIEANQAAGV